MPDEQAGGPSFKLPMSAMEWIACPFAASSLLWQGPFDGQSAACAMTAAWHSTGGLHPN